MYCPRCQTEYPSDWKACPKDASLLLKSARIGKYAIEGTLGIGGMGAVYRAKNPDTGAAVAVKVMNDEVAMSADARERFKREAGVVSRLDTRHVCKVFDFGADADGTMFLVMELMKGHTLREEIAPAPHYMDLARVQMVIDGALKGLAAAHREGIVHRDLKPDNIFVADTFDGEVPKLLDFGIARASGAVGESNLTRTGTMMGTATYMAPEQVSGATSQMGPWTDIYAMGAILYEVLAGAPAIDAATITEVLHRAISGQHVPLASVRAGLPPAVYALVERCLSVETSARPADAEAMRTALAQAMLAGSSNDVPPPRKTRVETATPGVAPTVGADGASRGLPSAPPAATARLGPSQAAAASQATPTAVVDKPATHGSRGRAPLVIGGVAVAVVGLAVAYVATHRDSAPASPAPTATVPVVAVAAIDAATTTSPEAALAVTPATPIQDPRCPESMVYLPAVTLAMGSRDDAGDEDEHPVHAVQVAAVCIDRTEVSVAAYARCAAAKKCHAAWPSLHQVGKSDWVSEADPACNEDNPDRQDHPANCVDQNQAKAYCAWQGRRLPTEAEWERAARGAGDREYPWGNQVPDASRAVWDRASGTATVGSHPGDATPEGVLDLAGNVSEWVDGVYAAYPGYSGDALIGLGSRVFRGGDFTDTVATQLRGTTRHWNGDVYRYPATGFRCAAQPVAPDASRPSAPQP